MLKKILIIICISFSVLTSNVNSRIPFEIDTKYNGQMYYLEAVRLHGKVDESTIFNLYVKAAEKENKYAQYNLAMMYFNGQSVDVDYQQAVYWFKKSAEQDFSTAQYRLAVMYLLAKGGLVRDTSQALILLEKAANQNEFDAQLDLAMLYESGIGVKRSLDKALYWINNAILNGHEGALHFKNLILSSDTKSLDISQRELYWSLKSIEFEKHP